MSLAALFKKRSRNRSSTMTAPRSSRSKARAASLPGHSPGGAQRWGWSEAGRRMLGLKPRQNGHHLLLELLGQVLVILQPLTPRSVQVVARAHSCVQLLHRFAQIEYVSVTALYGTVTKRPLWASSRVKTSHPIQSR